MRRRPVAPAGGGLDTVAQLLERGADPFAPERDLGFQQGDLSALARSGAQAMRASDDLVLSDRAAIVRWTLPVTSALVRSRIGVRRSADSVR